MGWTEMALKVASAKRVGPSREGDVAMERIAPFVTQTARRIHAAFASLRRQRAADFVDTAPAQVWKKIENFEDWYDRRVTPELRHDSPKDWFAAWCYVELRYRYLDQGRLQAAEQKVVSLTPGAAVVGRLQGGERVTDDDEPGGEFDLSPDELARVKSWDPLDGVILFTLSSQWDKVPPEVWKQWIERLGLTEPFPPAAFLQAPKPKKRAALADAAGVSRDVIYQRCLRLKQRFQKAVNGR